MAPSRLQQSWDNVQQRSRTVTWQLHSSLREQVKKRKQVIIDLSMLSLGILVLSFTVGKDLLLGQQPDLYSFSIIHFTGYLFFILMPVEVLLPYYLARGFDPFVLVVLAVLTAVIAQIIDYSIGHLTSSRVIHDLIGEKRYLKAEKAIRYYGMLTVFLFNLLPLSSPIVVFISGALRLRFRRVLLYSVAGLTIKYAVIVLLYWLF